MFYTPKQEMRSERVDQVYFSPNDRQTSPLVMVQKLQNCVEKAMKNPEYQKVWIRTTIDYSDYAGYDQIPEPVSGFVVDIMASRKETDEEYLVNLERELLRGTREREELEKMRQPQVLANIDSAKAQLESTIEAVKNKIKKDRENKSRENKRATLEKLKQELGEG